MLLNFYRLPNHFEMLFIKGLTLHDRSPYDIETSLLSCSANQWTGFYIIETSIMQELIFIYQKVLNTFQGFDSYFKSYFKPILTSIILGRFSEALLILSALVDLAYSQYLMRFCNLCYSQINAKSPQHHQKINSR